MANPRMDVTAFVGKLLEEDDADLLRERVRVLAQALMETEVSGQIGAAPYERSGTRTAYRNGYRTRTWDTRVGTIELKIPKVTAGTYFPSLLEPRRRAEKALHAVICEAYVKGISTRKVDDLVRALGMDGISKSEVSRICKALDAEVDAFLARPIEGEHPYVWLDATFHKTRELGRVISVATVVAVGVSETGERRVLGCDTGPSEDHAFWLAFLRGLVKRGLGGGARRDLRRPRGAPPGHRQGLLRCLLATVPGALHEEPPLGGSEDSAGDGSRRGAHDLLPGRPCLGDGAAPRCRSDAQPQVPRRRGPPRSCRRGSPRAPALPPGTPSAASLDKPTGAFAQGGQAAHERGGDLPEPRLAPPHSGDPVAGAGR